MGNLRAFVGHSFNESDSAIVNELTKFLDGVAGLDFGFEWCHAKKAAPIEVSEKVLSLISGCNVFIGVCTRKEIVAEVGASTTNLPLTGYALVQKARITWKTSDWVIQEIGLAIGRGMKIILLVEEGVRAPGSLQADMEYIPLERARPERSFNSLLEMISSLASRRVGSVARTAGVSAPESSAPEVDDDAAEIPLVISNSWSQSEFESQLFRAVILDRASDVQSLNLAYRSSAHALNSDCLVNWDALHERLKIQWGNDGSIAELRRLVESRPASARLQSELAEAYKHIGEFRSAIDWFDRAAGSSSEVVDRLNNLGKAAVLLSDSGQHAGAEMRIASMREMVAEDPRLESVFVGHLHTVAKREKVSRLSLALLERLIELDPGNVDLRFSAALEYSEADDNTMSLHQLLKIPVERRTPGAWNNLGVSRQSSGLPALAKEAYQFAADAGETLASANLAYLLLKVGFVKEAIATCRLASQDANHHKNVDAAIVQAGGALEEEGGKEDELRGGARKVSDFSRNAGRSAAFPMPPLAARWKASECILTARTIGPEDRTTVFSGVFVRKDTRLLLAFADDRGSKDVEFELSFIGKFYGRMFVGSRTLNRKGDAFSLLSSGSNTSTDVLMYLDDDCDTFQVMLGSGGKVTFETIYRVA